MDHRNIATMLEASRSRIIERVIHQTMQNPFWAERYGPGVRDKIIFDTEHNIAALTKAIRYRSQVMLDDYLAWLRTTLVRHRCSTGMLNETFAYIWYGIQSELPYEAQAPLFAYIEAGLNQLRYSQPTIQEIVAIHEQLAEDLTRHTFDMQWHWQRAYATSGRARCVYDMWLILDFAIDALGQNDPQVAVQHILWLRDGLLPRGLSTTHMQQLLWLLTGMLEQQVSPAAASDIRRVLSTAASALLYDDAAYHALLGAQDTLVQEIAQMLAPHGGVGAEQLMQETGWYVAYLGDALGLHQADPLVRYVSDLHQAGADPYTMQQHLAATHEAIARHLPAYALAEAQGFVQAAGTMLQPRQQVTG